MGKKRGKSSRNDQSNNKLPDRSQDDAPEQELFEELAPLPMYPRPRESSSNETNLDITPPEIEAFSAPVPQAEPAPAPAPAPQAEPDPDPQAEPSPDPEEKKTELAPLEMFGGWLGRGIKQTYFTAANWLYRYFYYLGLQMLRVTRTQRRHLTVRLHMLELVLDTRRRAARRSLVLRTRALWWRLTAPVRAFGRRVRDFYREVRAARRYGTPGKILQSVWRFVQYLAAGLWKIVKVLANYLLPVACCMVLYQSVLEFQNQQYVLEVNYNGERVGYIAEEAVFTRAESAMRERMILGDVLVADPTEKSDEELMAELEAENADDETPEVAPPTPQEQPAEELQAMPILVRMQLVRLRPEEGQHLTDVDALTDALIRAAGKSSGDLNAVSIEEADGLYISDEYVGAVTDGRRLLMEMDSMLSKYRTDDLSDNAVIQFVKKVQIKRGLYPTNSLRPLEDILQLLRKEERGKKIYTVVSGDTPITIAAKNGISFTELKALNPDVDIRLFPGDELLIAQSVPYLGVQVSETIKYEEEMDYQIKQEVDPNMDIGYTRVKQEGKEGSRVITAEIRTIDGVEVERNIIDRDVIKQPVDRILVVGGNQPLKFLPKSSSSTIQSGAFLWPADGGYISMPIYGYYGHTGTDIAGPIGTGIRASAAGTVVVAKYSAYGYGNYIIIEHGGGVQTLYGHNSKLLASVGQQVEQGELIALMGQTGNASGSHVHFEIRMNGQYMDARKYF